ncbi:hypothetical protein [Clostridium sp.]|uniref:hypothetical protein n=1 Tax=Clostridium sp. TaxID=1506 RepID=UPI003F67653F
MRTLYKSGSMMELWGYNVDHIVVEDHEVDAYISDGWVMHPFELDKKSDPDQDGDGKITQEEARAYLTEKGVDHSKMHWKTAVSEAAKLKAQEA